MIDPMNAPPVRVELELVPVRGPHGSLHVEGTVHFAGDEHHPISGWMSLLQVLERAVAAAAENSHA
jgi:hypothetical protein